MNLASHRCQGPRATRTIRARRWRLRLWVFGPFLAVPASAALWVDPNWALLGDMQAEVTYDTNLTARRENLEDTYGTLAPKLTLSRRGSATRFDVDVSVRRTWFMDFTEFNATDPQANLVFEYPVREGDEPRTHVNLHWGRNSTTNTDLGRRVRSENLRGRWDQRVFDTGKTVLDLRLDGRSTEYRETDLNTNESVALEARIGYAIAAQARLGIGYGHEWTRSIGAAGRGDTDGSEDRVTVRLVGELAPKLNGSIETGVAFVSYKGAVERDDTAWIAAVSLGWEPTVGSTATVRASRYTDFSPEGATALRSELMLDLTREVGRGFALRAGGGVALVTTYFGDTAIDADAVILLGGISYRLTERFSSELAYRWTEQDDDRDAFDYTRHLVTGEVNFQF